MNIMPSLLKSFGFFDDVLGFCFVFLVAPHGLWDLKFPEQGSTRDLTQVRDSESLCPNCWTAREFPSTKDFKWDFLDLSLIIFS